MDALTNFGYSGPFRGVVIDNKDPQQRGRVKAFIWGLHGQSDPNLP